jgi:small-conductance mechanosensitive channel
MIVLTSLNVGSSNTPLAFAQSGTTTPVVTPNPEDLPTPLPGVPIEVGGEVVGYVRERLGSLTPADRAELLSRDINELATNPFAPPVEFEVVESDIGTDILANGEVLLTITDADAAAVNADRQELAVYATDVIASAIERTRAQNTPRVRLMRMLESLAFLLATVLIFVFLNRFYHRLVRRIDAIQEAQDQRGLLRSTNFYRSGAWKGVANLLLNIGRWVLFLVIIIVVLPFVLRIFPATSSLAQQLINLLAIPLRAFWSWFVENRSNFLTLAIIALVIYVIIRLENWFFAEVSQGGIKISGFEPEWAPFTRKLVAFLLVVGGVVVAFPYIPGSGSAAFQGVSLFLGALITISSASAVTNIISGIIQTYTGSFSVGDVIKIGDVTGVVKEKRVLTTRVRTFKNEEVSIPNSAVLSGTVTNYSTMAKSKGLVLYTTVTIGYDAPWKKVQELLLAAAEAVPGVCENPTPFVLQTSLNDYHISYQLNCYTDDPERMPRIYSALHASIQDQFNQAGIEIMSPAFSALRDGNALTIPVENLPEDYEAPGFRVNS